MYKYLIVFLLLIHVLPAFAQTAKDSVAKEKPLFFNPRLNAVKTVTVIPQNFTASHLPFFCDKEWKLEKVTKIPFRFRLGSVAYCDKMEGKNE